MILDAAAKKALATAPDDAVFYDTLEITHSLFTHLLVNGYEALTNGGKTYQPWQFDYKLPSIEPNTLSEFEANIDNTRRSIITDIIGALETAEPIAIYYRMHIISGTINSIIDQSSAMHIISASDGDILSIRAAYPNIKDAVFLNERYSQSRFPGLAA